MIKEIKRRLEECIDRSDDNYYEDQVYMLQDYGYEVQYVDENIKNIGSWETDTEYVYKVTDSNTGDSILLAIIDTRGNTESQENQGITDIYEVRAKEVIEVVFEKVKGGK